MVIFDEKKMEQKPIYPTKKTPSYADWALFNMGKELEESITGGGGEITVDQEVIAGSENPVAGGAVKTYVDTEVGNVNEVPDSTAADVNKILTVDANGEPNWSTPLTPQVTVDQTVVAGSTNPVAGGGVKTYVDTEVAGVNEVPASTVADADKVLTVDSNGKPNWVTPSTPQITVDQTIISGSTNPVSGGAVKTYVDAIPTGFNYVGEYTENYTVPYNTKINHTVSLAQEYGNKDILVVVEGISDYMQVENICYDDSTSLLFATFNTGTVTSCTMVYSIYTRNKTDTDNNIIVVGQTGTKFNKIPDSSVSDEDKVLSVNHQGSPQWVYLEDITDELPPSIIADAGKVLTVNSSGNAEWQTPSDSYPSLHTYSTFGELATDLINHPYSIIHFTAFGYALINYSIISNNVYMYIYSYVSSTNASKFGKLTITSSLTDTSETVAMYREDGSSSTNITFNIDKFNVYY